jgi:LysR family glycine cleavage system transcriptional activator
MHFPSTASLRAFEASGRLDSFTAAATELAQTQGAVSHQIKELEQRLEGRLFDRGPRGISLTPAGEAYLPFVRQALDAMVAGAGALSRQSADRVLTVSMSPNFAAKWLVPRLGSFVEKHPDLDLRISASMEHVKFSDDGVDMAVRHGAGHWPNLLVIRLCEERIFPVCAPELVAGADGFLPISALAKLPLIHDRSRAGWEDWFEKIAVDDRPLASQLSAGPVFNQTALAIDAAVARQGVALARSALVALDLAAGRLVRPVTEEQDAPFAYYLVCPPDVAAKEKVRRFTTWLFDEAAADVGRLLI